MLSIKNAEVHGFDHAIRGMRNPMNSWDRSDSIFDQYIAVGKNDLDLMRRLYAAGPEHRKYLRMIHVWMDITAPLYWWKEFDTYKVGTVSNGCSTMHKIHEKEFTLEDFSCEKLWCGYEEAFKDYIEILNVAREKFLQTHKKVYWWQMIQMLPSSYNQKRTVSLNYETVVNIIKQREGHKLDEWGALVAALKKLPYIEEIKGEE